MVVSWIKNSVGSFLGVRSIQKKWSFFVFALLFIVGIGSIKGQEKFASPAAAKYLLNKNKVHPNDLKGTVYSPTLWSIDSTTSDEYPFVLKQSLTEAASIIRNSIHNGKLNAAFLQEVFEVNPRVSKKLWIENANKVLEGLLDSKDSLEIVLASLSDMKGAMGAFSPKGLSHPTIFFANEFIQNKASWIYPSATNENLTRIIIEEIGHYIDFKLNGTYDTKGDEGELFSYLLLNKKINDIYLGQLKNRIDKDSISFNSERFDVERCYYVLLGCICWFFWWFNHRPKCCCSKYVN